MSLKKFIHKHIHLWDVYDKANEFFVAPKLRFYFGSWKKYGGLPVWRRGLIINIGKYGQYKDKDDRQWYGAWAKHQVWDEKFLSTCSAFGKLWRRIIKPTYQLPDWLSFYYSNRDIMYKEEHDNWCYEYPGQFCIVAFSLCFAMWPEAAVTSTDYRHGVCWPCSDSYWEAILEFIYGDKNLSDEDRLREAIKRCGVSTITNYTTREDKKRQDIWNEIKKTDWRSEESNRLHKKLDSYHGMKTSWNSCRPEYLTPAGQSIWKELDNEMKNSKKYINHHWL